MAPSDNRNPPPRRAQGERRGAATALAAAQTRLAAAGVDDPVGDARRLLAHALGCEGPAALVPRDLAAPLSDAEASAFDAAIAARSARRPVSQILGRRAFFQHVFEVTADVLDPRPESETLVIQALSAAPEDAAIRVLDLGVGSGCLLLSVLAARPRAVGVGIDASNAALSVAGRNAAALGVAERACLRRGDWTGPGWAAAIGGDFNLILSNPPYISDRDFNGLAPEVRLWEPKAALSPGGDGLDAYRAIAPAFDALAAPQAVVLFEVGAGQATAVLQICAEAGWAGRSIADLNGVARVVEARRSGHAARAQAS